MPTGLNVPDVVGLGACLIVGIFLAGMYWAQGQIAAAVAIGPLLGCLWVWIQFVSGRLKWKPQNLPLWVQWLIVAALVLACWVAG